jgi:hypothetical protein
MPRGLSSRRRSIFARRQAKFLIEVLEARTLLSTATVSAGTTVRTVPSNFLGVNTAPWDGQLTSAQTLSLSQAAGINSVRIGGGSYIDGASGATDTNGWHFDVTQSNNATLPQQLAYVTGLSATAIIDMDYGTASPQEAAAELAYLNAPINNPTIDNVVIGNADKFTGTAIGNGSITGGWVSGGGVTESGVTSWQTVGFWATLRSQTSAANPTNSDGLNFLRIGQAAPYGFHDYEIGNEIYGSWEADAQGTTTGANDLTGLLPNSGTPAAHDPTTIIAWGKEFESFSSQIDSTISVGIDSQDPVNNTNINPFGGGTDGNWINDILTQSVAQGFTLGYIADHYYTNPQHGSENDATLLGTPNTSASGNTYDLSQRINDYDSDIHTDMGSTGNNVQLIVDEFNSVSNTPGKQTTSLVNALFVADALGAAVNTTGSNGLGGAQGVWLWDLHNGGTNSGANESSSLYGWRTGTGWGDYGLLGSSSAGGDTGSGSNWLYPDYFAMQMASKFIQSGGTVVSATEDNETGVDTYSILEPNGHLDLLVVNKTKGTLANPSTTPKQPGNLPDPTLTEQFNITGFNPSTTAAIWQYGVAEDDAEDVAGNGQGALTHLTNVNLGVSSGGFSYALPDYSMTLFDLSPAGPAIVNAAAAAPSTVTGTTTTLTALAQEGSTDTGLIYTWSATGPAPISMYSDNASNTAKSTIATFAASGPYTFTVTIKDASNQTITSSVNVMVNATLSSSITVTPSSPSVADGQTQAFTASALDQFNNPMTPVVTWSIDSGGVGSVDGTGLYTAPAGGPGSATVRATSGSVSGAATVNIILSNIIGTDGDDNIRLVRNGDALEVYTGLPAVLAYSVPYSSLTTLEVNALDGDDTIAVDFSGGGSPVPAGGLTIDGGSGTDSLVVTGTSGDDSTTVNASSLTVNGSLINYPDGESIIMNPSDGSDTLAVNAGTVTLPASAGGVLPVPLASLSIADNATVSLAGPPDPANHNVLILGNLSNAGTLDIGANNLILQGAGDNGLTDITTQLTAGFNAGHGYWNGASGIVSTVAAGDTTFLTTLGVMVNSTGDSFDSQPSNVGDVLVKYTYYGDADLNGTLNGADYQQIDDGYGLQTSQWSKGDFNYDGVIDGSDYSLIDNAYNQLTATSASSLALLAGNAAITARSSTASSSAKRVFAAQTPAATTPVFNQSTSIAPGATLDDLLDAWNPHNKHE